MAQRARKADDMATLTMPDGTPKEIRIDFRAYRELEGMMTRSVLEVLGHHGAMFKLDELVAVLWAAWHRDDRTLTLNGVRRWVETFLDEGGSFLDLHTAVTDALAESPLFKDRDRPAAPSETPSPSTPS